MREMKDSGVEWIGEIPREWQLLRFKDKYINKKEIAKEKSLEYERLALTLNGVIKRPKDDSEGLQPKEFDGYQIIEVNDFVFKMIDLQNISTSRVGLSPYSGLVSPAYIRFSSKSKNQYNQFVYYYLMSLYYNRVFNNLGGNGVRSALNAKDMGEFLVPYPTENEQIRICSCLDKKITQVNTLITNVQAQIEKLKAYKQSLITEVVTKGLDSTVPMKDSGVEWIGEIPEHWTISKIKNVATILRGASPRPIDAYLVPHGTGENWIKIGDTVKGHKYISKTAQQVSHEGADKSRRVHKGDLILTNSMSYGEPYILSIDGCIHDGWLAFTLLQVITRDYLYYFLQSSFCFNQFKHQVAGGIVQNLNSEKVASCIIFSPSEREQEEIVAYLDRKCVQIDHLITIKQLKIEKLEQYKRSLIYEYVTGKKEVI